MCSSALQMKESRLKTETEQTERSSLGEATLKQDLHDQMYLKNLLYKLFHYYSSIVPGGFLQLTQNMHLLDEVV